MSTSSHWFNVTPNCRSSSLLLPIVLAAACAVESDRRTPASPSSEPTKSQGEVPISRVSFPVESPESVESKETKESEAAVESSEVLGQPAWSVVSEVKKRIGERSWNRIELHGRIEHNGEWLESTGELLVFSPPLTIRIFWVFS